MRTTITIRAEPQLREALQRRAAAQGLSLSAFVRSILEECIGERPLAARIRRLRGSVELPGQDPDDWQRRIRDRNWRS